MKDRGPVAKGVYPGCVQEEGEAGADDGKLLRTMTFNQDACFEDTIPKYKQLGLDKVGTESKLSVLATPYLKGSSKETVLGS